MSWAPTYAELALDSTNGITLEKTRETAKVTAKFVQTLGAGSAVAQVAPGGRRIDVSGKIIGTTTSELTERVEALLEVLTRPDGGYLTLAAGRRILAYAVPGSVDVLKSSSNLAASWSASLTAPAAYWESTTLTTGSEAIGAGGSATATLAYSGTAPVRPTWKIRQATGTVANRAVSLVIANRTPDEAEYIRITNGALGNDTDYITLDPVAENAHVSGAVDSYTSGPSRLDGAFPVIVAGTNSLAMDALSTGGNLVVEFEYRDNYYTGGF
jgi:hypothetical protein